jgi:hypothetical protein
MFNYYPIDYLATPAVRLQTGVVLLAPAGDTPPK